ncbi:CTP synthase [Bifidobacterium amazonense]|uniref:CTP synthase n=1 Tax=Bifidobacterium amazonense TaxID=2809027 RepID=A0ABS9VY41_9BIFI|nr:CTP synthase [Bifidobacterium amazonense]MCH9277030.1 CTP synthase [Bifidobacterium amazonense]
MGKNNRHVDILLRQAQQQWRCVIANDQTERMALIRRAQQGKVARPYRGLYVDAAYWQTLNPSQRIIHLARTLCETHPTWVFAGPTAAALYGYDHPWSIHRAGLYIADSVNATGRRNATPLNRIYMPDIPVNVINGIRLTSPARTLLDCGLILPFGMGLAIFDAALATHTVSKKDVLDLCDHIARDCTPVMRLLRYADPKSENSGESTMRGLIVEDGFMVPDLQRVFTNPQNSQESYRVDFSWTLGDGRILVAEYDGMAKYTDPSMTGRQSVKSVVNRQVQRERNLLAWGASAITRLDYDDIINRQSAVDKLVRLGVPRGAPPFV